MRLSKPDAIDPQKRRHFEISIDSPFHILSCRATQANIALPAYTSPESTTLLSEHSACGCPGAPRRRNSPSSLLPDFQNLRVDQVNLPDGASSGSDDPPTQSLRRATTAGLTRPQAAHIHNSDAPSGAATPNQAPRPMHLMRAPSFNPPAFTDDDPPPALMTPPPNYNSLIDENPRTGLADYFARLADEVGEEEDAIGSMSLQARMEMPLTPGGRVNRSMDERRTWLPLGGAIAQ